MKIKFQFNVSLQKDAEEKKNTVTVNNSSFVDCARKEILNARERGSFSTAANYDTALRSFLTFIKREDIMLDDITTEMLESYQKWLLRRNVSLNTVSCYMRSLRSIYNRATDSKSRVFSRIFTGSTPTYKRSLCVDDIQRLSALKLSKGSRLALARDIFLFSFYCQGMPFIDLAFLRKEQVVNGSIVYNRHKTGQITHRRGAVYGTDYTEIQQHRLCVCIPAARVDRHDRGIQRVSEAAELLQSRPEAAWQESRIQQTAHLIRGAPFVGEHRLSDQCGATDNLKGYGAHQPYDHINIYKGAGQQSSGNCQP